MAQRGPAVGEAGGQLLQLEVGSQEGEADAFTMRAPGEGLVEVGVGEPAGGEVGAAVGVTEGGGVVAREGVGAAVLGG